MFNFVFFQNPETKRLNIFLSEVRGGGGAQDFDDDEDDDIFEREFRRAEEHLGHQVRL